MCRTIPRVSTRASISLAVLSGWLVLACSVPSVPAADAMEIAKTEAGYLVTLGEQQCVRFSTPELAKCGVPRVDVTEAGDGWQRVRMTWDVAEPIAQNELSIRFDLAIEPDFW